MILHIFLNFIAEEETINCKGMSDYSRSSSRRSSHLGRTAKGNISIEITSVKCLLVYLYLWFVFMFVVFVWLFRVLRHTRKLLTHIETLPLLVNGCKF